MKPPCSIIDPPSPFDPPEVLWDFLRRLREFNQDDPAVQAAREEVMRYLVIDDDHEREPS